MSSPYYQYGLELGGGNRTDFFVGTASGPLVAIGGTTLPFNQWSHLAITFDGAQVRTYVNGTLVNTQALSATITARGNPMNIGADASPAQFNKGLLDDLRIYNRVLTQAQIQTDMTTPVGGPIAGSPQVLIDFPANGAQVRRHRQCDCRRDRRYRHCQRAVLCRQCCNRLTRHDRSLRTCVGYAHSEQRCAHTRRRSRPT